ncbi:MAG TPA: C4-dicarboxylic acid transporter DauA [Thermoanaerobaculia bacterium]|nr:C4-dicarboxylic acid transporter DauA [Thermoanaerobaculia bacterium]
MPPPDLSMTSTQIRLSPRLAGARYAVALRRALAQGYGAADLRADLMAGLVVGIVALPLSMALAIASGVPPQYGLYTAIVAGLVIALLGGSKVQVSGPTAAFVVILAPIASRHGLGGLCLATLLAGLLLAAMGLSRFGRFVEFVPYPVTTGFTAGIGIVIGVLQLKDFFGVTVAATPPDFLERVVELARGFPSLRWSEALVGATTLAVLLLWPRFSRRVPAPLAALTAGTLVGLVLGRFVAGAEVATIASRFSTVVDGVVRQGIPQLPPLPLLPWRLPGGDGAPLVLSLELVRELLPSAFAIAMLGAIESLLSAVVADGMTGRKHDPDAELLAQGIGNVVAPFFGGIAATGAIARTATNVRAGARTPIAAVVHSLFILVAVVALAPLLGFLPMAALAALLLQVAWRMAEAKHVAHMLRVSPRADNLVLLSCLGLTVLFDMVVAVTVGIVFAALLFMQRMAAVSRAQLVNVAELELEVPLPPNVLLYEIAGPLFFGAANKAMTTLRTLPRKGFKVVILDVSSVPIIDATGLVALDSTVGKLRDGGLVVVLAGVQQQPLRVLARAGWRNVPGSLAIGRDFDKSVEVARAYALGSPEASGLHATRA